MIAATLTCWCQSNHNGDLQDWKNYIKKFYEPTLKWMRDPTGKDVLGTYPQVCNNARYRASTNNTGSASNTTPSNSPCATPPIAHLFARRTSRTNTTCRRSSSSRHTRCATCCACSHMHKCATMAASRTAQARVDGPGACRRQLQGRVAQSRAGVQ